MKKRPDSRISLVLAILLSLGTILYVFYKLDWRSIEKTLTGLHWGWLALALFVYFLNYILRALRLQIINPTKGVPFLDLVAVNGLYGMYNYLLPARTGEISYIVLVNRRLRLSVGASTASLLVTRYLDFAAIAAILPFVLLPDLRTLPAWLVSLSAAFFGVVLLASLALYWFVKPNAARSEQRPATRFRWLDRILRLWKDMQDGLVAIYRRGQMVPLLFLSIAIWICVNTMFYLVILSLGHRVSYFQIMLISIIMIPMTLLPLQGFANLGTHEIGWVTAFSIFGQPEAAALNIAFNSHIIILLFVLILGAVSFLISMAVERTHPISERSAD